MNNFQKKGSISNAHVGRTFEELAKKVVEKKLKITLQKDYALEIGLLENKPKEHKFDLGSVEHEILIECKSHTWTSGNNVPSAKMTVWNEAMYYFHLAPKDYRKIHFVLKDYNDKKDETLAHYYKRTYAHLIPKEVEIWEYDSVKKNVTVV
ncbi:MAG: hypothetical protein ABUK01_04965 [Leptospirales bacterium]